MNDDARTDEHWRAIESLPAFRDLIAQKKRFIIPATVFFVVYYFALPILVGYLPDMMSTDVFGKVNVAYLFALSQFGMAWILMALYVRRARKFDAMAAVIIADVQKGDGDDRKSQTGPRQHSMNDTREEDA